MDTYLGKICPYCKTEIKDGELVKVCPECTIPHHLGCWQENGGCTTFGCSEQSGEPTSSQTVSSTAGSSTSQYSNSASYSQSSNADVVKCTKCGAELAPGQDFCSKCGTHRNANLKRKCASCGTELEVGQEFCPRCGQKAGGNGLKSALGKVSAGKNKIDTDKLKKVLIIAAAVIVVIALAIIILPKVFISVEGLCAKGDYEKAYKKAKTSKEKEEVLAESNIAYLSYESSEGLKDPSSFVLRDAYYREFINEDGEKSVSAVLYISGNNSYGAAVSSYWYYSYDEDLGEWEYMNSLSSLVEEEYSTYDTDDERSEKLYDNLCIMVIEDIMGDNDTIDLDRASVKNINNLFEQDKLGDIEPIEIDID